LDVGCGEGWLARALAAEGADVLGVDGSEALVAAARAADGAPATRAAGGGRAHFELASYADLIARPERAAGPFALVVCNFALLGDPLAPLLAALRRRLAGGGRLVVQTVHPWAAAGDGPYESGWRVETFAAFERPFPCTMPWFFRTLASWLAELRAARLRVLELDEPTHPDTGRPLSLLIECDRAPA
ncbi:MAG TPA: class I SAM-dependent methyltransferase, partial [Gemmatimonadaceae bacterium]|nr:class I SAM-dependent methyltransferase [Gemmatimonadaceae bacterium]